MRKLLIPLSLLAALGLIGGIYAKWFKRYPSILQAKEACEKWADNDRWDLIYIRLFHDNINDIQSWRRPDYSDEDIQNKRNEILATFPEAEISNQIDDKDGHTDFSAYVSKRWCIEEKETNQFLGSKSFFVDQADFSWPSIDYISYKDAKRLKGESEVKKNFRYPIQK